MIVVQLQGGLGNQLFEYALGRQLAVINRCSLKLDAVTAFATDAMYRRQYALGPFHVTGRMATEADVRRARTPAGGYRVAKALFQIRQRLPLVVGARLPAIGSEVREEGRQFQFDGRVLAPSWNNVLLRGYWQNEKYFKAIAPVLRREVTLRRALSGAAAGYADAIQRTRAVALHVRQVFAVVHGRPNPEGLRVHGCLGWDYYEAAMRLIRGVEPDPHVFVFADDQEWARAHVRLSCPVTFVEGCADYEDLVLMSRCRHQIMANSSFSWWAAWLNANPQKRVVAPKAFLADPAYDTSDLYPKDWIVV